MFIPYNDELPSERDGIEFRQKETEIGRNDPLWLFDACAFGVRRRIGVKARSQANEFAPTKAVQRACKPTVGANSFAVARAIR
ncbi:hypothetical protein [Pseudomonas sp. B392_1p]|uniref:hypothetical protein n=1 Tax=Pseudomonas sp. B392_1p TaxID=3457507 RepID=UPI003FCF7B02